MCERKITSALQTALDMLDQLTPAEKDVLYDHLAQEQRDRLTEENAEARAAYWREDGPQSTAAVEIGTLIVHTADINGGQLYIAGTGIMVQDVVGWHKLGRSPKEIVKELGHLTLAQVHAALAYYHANREKIESAIAVDKTKADRFGEENYQTAWTHR